MFFKRELCFSSSYLTVNLWFKNRCWISMIITHELTDSSTIVKNNIMCGKTKELGGIWSCIPVFVDVITLFSDPLLYCLCYLDWWDNQEKEANYSGKHWAKHEYKTLGFITLRQFNRGSYELSAISSRSIKPLPNFHWIGYLFQLI